MFMQCLADMWYRVSVQQIGAIIISLKYPIVPNQVILNCQPLCSNQSLTTLSPGLLPRKEPASSDIDSSEV